MLVSTEETREPLPGQGSPTGKPTVQQRLIDRSVWSARSHIRDDAEPAAWPAEAPRFSQDELFIGRMAQACYGPDYVKTGLGGT